MSRHPADVSWADSWLSAAAAVSTAAQASAVILRTWVIASNLQCSGASCTAGFPVDLRRGMGARYARHPAGERHAEPGTGPDGSGRRHRFGFGVPLPSRMTRE